MEQRPRDRDPEHDTHEGPRFERAAALTGSVDSRKQEILDLLEGGAEAFVERERYYGELLAGSNGEITEAVHAET